MRCRESCSVRNLTDTASEGHPRVHEGVEPGRLQVGPCRVCTGPQGTRPASSSATSLRVWGAGPLRDGGLQGPPRWLLRGGLFRQV